MQAPTTADRGRVRSSVGSGPDDREADRRASPRASTSRWAPCTAAADLPGRGADDRVTWRRRPANGPCTAVRQRSRAVTPDARRSGRRTALASVRSTPSRRRGFDVTGSSPDPAAAGRVGGPGRGEGAAPVGLLTHDRHAMQTSAGLNPDAARAAAVLRSGLALRPARRGRNHMSVAGWRRPEPGPMTWPEFPAPSSCAPSELGPSSESAPPVVTRKTSGRQPHPIRADTHGCASVVSYRPPATSTRARVTTMQPPGPVALKNRHPLHVLLAPVYTAVPNPG